jgi:hypothetical protein
MDCRVKPGNDASQMESLSPTSCPRIARRKTRVNALMARIHVFLSCDRYRTNSRIALSSPSSVSGYIRPPIT